MSLGPQPNILTALDIGTSKVTAMIGQMDEQGGVHVVGLGTQPSYGVKKGLIVNMETTFASVQKALEDAQTMANLPIKNATIAISGVHLHGFNSSGVAPIAQGQVSEQDVNRVIDAAQAVAIPSDQKILHLLPQAFTIDQHTDIQDPLGISGVRLEAKVHMVTASVTATQTHLRAASQVGLAVQDIVMSSLASSEAVLLSDEKELGVCLVDIGAGTTDVAVFINGAMVHSFVLPIGGIQVSNDLAHALRAPFQFAENIKLRHGTARASLVNSHEAIEIPGMLDRPGKLLSLQTVAEVIESRYEELFLLIQQNLAAEGLCDYLSAGFVLTGGASKMPGLLNLVEKIFRLPAREGYPDNIMGLKEAIADPIYSTCAGLLLYTHQQIRNGEEQATQGSFSKQKETALETMEAELNLLHKKNQSNAQSKVHSSFKIGGQINHQITKVKSWFSKYF